MTYCRAKEKNGMQHAFTSCEDHGSSRGRLKFRRKKCERKRPAPANHHAIFALGPESLVDYLDFWPALRTHTRILRSMSKLDMYCLICSLRRERERVPTHADFDDCEREGKRNGSGGKVDGGRCGNRRLEVRSPSRGAARRSHQPGRREAVPSLLSPTTRTNSNLRHLFGRNQRPACPRLCHHRRRWDERLDGFTKSPRCAAGGI